MLANMSYRLLALDLDGTLLRSDGRVDDRDIAAIRELRASGTATITIVTGRLHTGALEAAHATGIEGVIACMEGSHLVEVATSRTHAHHAMSAATTRILREAFTPHELAVFIFERDGIHHDERGERYAPYVRTWSPQMRLVEHALDERVWANDPLAAVALGPADAVQQAHAAIRAHDATIFAVSFPVSHVPGAWAILVRAAGRNKGIALGEICAAAGCTLAEAVAVGDWVNDVPMFEVAGRSFAMGGTPDHVRSKATDTLDAQTGAGGGIAEAIRRAWG